MAITGAIFNSLIYGGIDSADYGIYITGEAVYNAPERAVELVSVPGRNGSIAIDQGHWENIEIEYPAGCFGDDQTDFATALSDFRNAICSQLGYQRLSDTYHPDEYRMALYIAGLEVSPTRKANGTGGEFSIKFNAKPQRWLTSGEVPVSVTSGDTLTNPTQYPSSPLLAVEGYGTIEFNGNAIEIENAVMGEVEIAASKQIGLSDSPRHIIRTSTKALYNIGDTITFRPSTFAFEIHTSLVDDDNSFDSVVSITDSDANFSTQYMGLNNRKAVFMVSVDACEWTAGTDGTLTDSISITMKMASGSTKTFGVSLSDYYQAEGAYSQSYLGFTLTATSLPSNYYASKFKDYTLGSVVVDSTVSILGHPTYIDCDLGEVYMIKDGSPVSLNRYIGLGSDLPTLASGANEVTYDNTVTDLEITPRWWKL